MTSPTLGTNSPSFDDQCVVHRCPREACLAKHVFSKKAERVVVSGENFADGIGALLLAYLRVLRILFECLVWTAAVIAIINLCLMLLGHGGPAPAPPTLSIGHVHVPPAIYTIAIGTITSLPRLISSIRSKR